LRYVNMSHKFFQTATESITIHPLIHDAELRLQPHQFHIA
jgi:hypothetical protein